MTVGEKIGKEHLTYTKGASAEPVAMGTIFAAGQPHANPDLGRYRYDGDERLGPAVGHDEEPGAGLGA